MLAMNDWSLFLMERLFASQKHVYSTLRTTQRRLFRCLAFLSLHRSSLRVLLSLQCALCLPRSPSLLTFSPNPLSVIAERFSSHTSMINGMVHDAITAAGNFLTTPSQSIKHFNDHYPALFGVSRMRINWSVRES